jgi:hypothetical protein
MIYNLLMKLTTKVDKNSQARTQEDQRIKADEMHVSHAIAIPMKSAGIR